MGLPNVMNTGRSGMVANKAAIATTGHNIANATTEGFSRQRVIMSPDKTHNSLGSGAMIGSGVHVARVERVNDQYIEKQIRNANRDLAHFEEKDLILKQAEDVFNEMGGEGLNRVMGRFFNEFRKLSNDPNNEALRQSVREATQGVVNDFHRIRTEVEDIRRHIDAKLEGDVREVNSLANTIKDLNIKIKQAELGGASPNDMLDQRDKALKDLGSYMDLSMHTDNNGAYVVEIRGIGPLVVGGQVESFFLERSKSDDRGKPEGSYEVHTSATVTSDVTHSLKGGKIGAILEARDQTLSTVLDRMDKLAYNLTASVNEIHSQGVTRGGGIGVNFFKPLDQEHRAAEYISLSDEVAANANNIAAAASPDSPGDNRIAIAISGLQNQHLMNDGHTTFDDFYNSIVSDVGVSAASNRSTINQQKDIVNQLGKMRDQISGVSLDEETANLLQFQHAYDASAHVIKVADECLKTVLSLRG